jgi:hypothetical protein
VQLGDAPLDRQLAREDRGVQLLGDLDEGDLGVQRDQRKMLAAGLLDDRVGHPLEDPPQLDDEPCDVVGDELADERSLVRRRAGEAHARHEQDLVALQELGHVPRFARVRPPDGRAEPVRARQDLGLAPAKGGQPQGRVDGDRRLRRNPQRNGHRVGAYA